MKTETQTIKNTGFGIDFEVLTINGRKVLEITNHLAKRKFFADRRSL